MSDATDRFYGRPRGLSSRQARNLAFALVAGALLIGFALGVITAHAAPETATQRVPITRTR
jgi:hypothetical protein